MRGQENAGQPWNRRPLCHCPVRHPKQARGRADVRARTAGLTGPVSNDLRSGRDLSRQREGPARAAFSSNWPGKGLGHVFPPASCHRSVSVKGLSPLRRPWRSGEQGRKTMRVSARRCSAGLAHRSSPRGGDAVRTAASVGDEPGSEPATGGQPAGCTPVGVATGSGFQRLAQSVRPRASASTRSSRISFANLSGLRDCGPSDSACSGRVHLDHEPVGAARDRRPGHRRRRSSQFPYRGSGRRSPAGATAS